MPITANLNNTERAFVAVPLFVNIEIDQATGAPIPNFLVYDIAPGGQVTQIWNAFVEFPDNITDAVKPQPDGQLEFHFNMETLPGTPEGAIAALDELIATGMSTAYDLYQKKQAEALAVAGVDA